MKKCILLTLLVFSYLGTATAQMPRNETLFVNGFQWGPPSSFNPIGPVRAWPSDGGGFNLIYESLLTFNLITGELEPRLASGVTENKDTFVVTLQGGTTFQDGQPLTSEDVVYSYGLGKRQNVEYTPFWDYVKRVKAADKRTITFVLNSERLNLGMVRSFLTTVAILPKYIWAPLEQQQASLTQFANLELVGSGPYKLMSANNERIILQRVENY